MKPGPLSGFVIGVTADRRSGEQIELLQRKGATVVHGPTIQTHPLGAEKAVLDVTRQLIADPPEITVLTTGLGVRGWFEAAESVDLGEPLLDALSHSTIYARGKKAHGAAITAGLAPGWQAPAGISAELVDELAARGVSGTRIAVQLDGGAGSPVGDALAALGADVVNIPVYRWTLPADLTGAAKLIGAIADHRVHAVTFTARPQIENLCVVAAELDLQDALVGAFQDAVRPICVGPVCAAAALDAGFGKPLVPHRFRLGSMVHVMADYFDHRAIDITMAGIPVRIQGTVVVIEGQQINLTDREAELLHALAAKVGAVVSKPQLLERVWQGQESDEHVVEVTVGRLRSRLGEAGLGVETVVRRGYRLSAA